ncbi:MAG: hypothetical protein IT375_35540 [Polyangiaceae bacterium]|nr:hypothetical protein [Polyangiaceae bacterium]
MRARRLPHAVSVCLALAIVGSCGGSTNSDESRDGGRDGSPPDVAHEAAYDGEAGADAPITDSADAEAANDADAHCACPPTPPLDGGACCTTGGCSYCDAVKWELVSAACKGGTWIINMQSDTPCGDN